MDAPTTVVPTTEEVTEEITESIPRTTVQVATANNTGLSNDTGSEPDDDDDGAGGGAGQMTGVVAGVFLWKRKNSRGKGWYEHEHDIFFTFYLMCTWVITSANSFLTQSPLGATLSLRIPQDQ